ncbi:MAG: nucleotide sugar dehydrogenase [Firmicutes bacterium]|nr:nucleotide sugar dehydrogenase [Bacillota bacterium]
MTAEAGGGPPLGDRFSEFVAGIHARRTLVGIVGMGYVGLPLALEKVRAGFKVLGFDHNPARVQTLREGRSYIDDVRDADLTAPVEAGSLIPTGDFDRLADPDVILICVPTPLTITKDPDLSHILHVTGLIARHLRPGQLISLESTTYPGTTEELILPLLSGGGLKVGVDFFLAFSPERIDPGNRSYQTRNSPKIVAGVTPACLEAARLFYSQTIERVIPVSSPRVAELVKVFENTYRAVNIALVNELALLCDRMGLDVWEIVEAAGTKPFGIQTFHPGPGVGGHCIPIDPHYLTWKAREYGFHTRFIELASEVNESMPAFVKEKVQRAMNDRYRSLAGSRILVLGVAYKRDIADARESPALKVMRLLEDAGAEVAYHDPLIPELEGKYYGGRPLRSVTLDEGELKRADCVVILTDHSSYDPAWIAAHASLIVDTRNITGSLPREAGPAERRCRIVKL